MSSDRELRMRKVVVACARADMTPLSALESIQGTWGVTKRTARSYLDTLQKSKRLVKGDDGLLVPGPNARPIPEEEEDDG